MSKSDVVIVSGGRTPVGTFGGALRDLSAVEHARRRRGIVRRSRNAADFAG